MHPEVVDGSKYVYVHKSVHTRDCCRSTSRQVARDSVFDKKRSMQQP